MRRFPEIRRAVGARRPLALLATVVAATLAAGCGGDSETPPATAQRAATPHAGAARIARVRLHHGVPGSAAAAGLRSSRHGPATESLST